MRSVGELTHPVAGVEACSFSCGCGGAPRAFSKECLTPYVRLFSLSLAFLAAAPHFFYLPVLIFIDPGCIEEASKKRVLRRHPRFGLREKALKGGLVHWKEMLVGDLRIIRADAH
mmetsp:Transcript_7129/g.18553  ORF Transcript_7129/g.18553 Transcript_7129/m.18553 type:complete len:115 (-) Transcript_7129:598-942(-)